MRFRNFTRLEVERLESRWTPAGNVTASVVGDTVFIVGDPFDNRIVVQAGPNRVTVFGGTQTTVNQQASPAIFNFDSAPKVVIETAQGDDFVSLLAFGCAGVTLLTGTGNDEVFFLPGGLVGVVGNVTIDTAQGNDSIHLVDFSALGNLAVDAGKGDDAVEIDGAVVYGDVAVAMGEGDDSLRIIPGSFGDLVIGGALSLDGGPGYRDSILLNFGFNTPPAAINIQGFEQ